MTDQFEAHAREIACAANGYCDGPIDSDGHGLGCNETYAAILAAIRSAVEAEREAGQREIDRLSSEVDLLTKVLRELYDAAYDDGGALSVELGQKVSLALKRSRTVKEKSQP